MSTVACDVPSRLLLPRALQPWVSNQVLKVVAGGVPGGGRPLLRRGPRRDLRALLASDGFA